MEKREFNVAQTPTAHRGRRTDRDRMLRLLFKEGQLSNSAVETRLGLSNERYDTVRKELIDSGAVEAYRCRGGGIRLTPRGKEEAAQKINDTVEKDEDRWTGTGFYVSRTNVLTNFHVIDGAKGRIRISLSGSPSLRARVVAKDEANDLALLETEQTQIIPPRFRGDVRIGEDIAVYGFPIAMWPTLQPQVSFADGIVNARVGWHENTAFLQHSARSLPGNSGGPVLDHDGNVVAIVSGGIDAITFYEHHDVLPMNVNYAVKGEIALDFLRQNGVRPKTAGDKIALRSWCHAAELAKSFTVYIECNVPEAEMPAAKVTKSGFWGRILAG